MDTVRKVVRILALVLLGLFGLRVVYFTAVKAGIPGSLITFGVVIALGVWLIVAVVKGLRREIQS